jgi:hypothetical protein
MAVTIDGVMTRDLYDQTYFSLNPGSHHVRISAMGPGSQGGGGIIESGIRDVSVEVFQGHQTVMRYRPPMGLNPFASGKVWLATPPSSSPE